MVFGASGAAVLDGGTLAISGARGEVGTTADLQVWLPAGSIVDRVQVDGGDVKFDQVGDGLVRARVIFAGALFRQLQQVGEYDPSFAGGTLRGTFAVPARVFDQLKARREAWPMPWTAEDYRATWLAPERLLLYVQIAEPDDAWKASLTIDGRTVRLEKAYTAIRAVPRTFVGFYADVSLLEADREHTFELMLPRLRPGQLQGLFFENVEAEYTTIIAR